MSTPQAPKNLLAQLDGLNAQQLRRLLVEHLTKQKLGLYWEASAIERDAALNADMPLPRLVQEWSHRPNDMAADAPHRNLIIEGDNFDSLRLLRSTHAGRVRVIYIDPPYNTGNKDWVYNDHYVGANDRWRHSMWLEFLYRRLTLARDLLTPDGVILVSINDENRARLELLMDEVFPGRRVGSFVWRSRTGGNDTKGAFHSTNHEHVLIYANEGFEFTGSGRDEDQYGNPDNDQRGAWINDNLVKAHNAKERPEAYYSILNPETDTWYLCDPDSVWRFSSTSRPLKKKLQADPIETIIQEKRILWPTNEETAIYATEQELLKAIKAGVAPKQLRIYLQLKNLAALAEKDPKVNRLLSYIEPLQNWVGRKIGYGKPRYKRFRRNLLRDVTPLSSWMQPAAEGALDDEDADDVITLTVGNTSEGTALVKKIIGNKDFPYPKPFSLIYSLLAQATKPNDIVLDFFAGSATTGQAVLELNAEDGGQRRFILCSSTEATVKEPEKNLCRDLCAERMRRVMQGYGNKPGYSVAQGGEFAYLQLEKIQAADAYFEASPALAFQWLALHRLGVALPHSDAPIQRLGRVDDCELLVCHEVTDDVIEQLAAWPAQSGAARLAVYCLRPDTLREQLAARGVQANTYGLVETLLRAQAGVAA